MNTDIFGRVPIILLQDNRITGRDIRVYIAISSFQGGKSDCFPSREKIADRAGVHVSHVSPSTHRLAEFGYIKIIRRGKKLSNVYRVKSNVSQLDTSPASDYAKMDPSNVSVTDQSIIKEQLKEHPSDPAPPERIIQKSIISNALIEFRKQFEQRFMAKMGSPYVYQYGKDDHLAKLLIEKLGLEVVLRKLDVFFSQDDGFIKMAGYTVGVLSSQINKLKIVDTPVCRRASNFDGENSNVSHRLEEAGLR